MVKRGENVVANDTPRRTSADNRSGLKGLHSLFPDRRKVSIGSMQGVNRVGKLLGPLPISGWWVGLQRTPLPDARYQGTSNQESQN
jgi:hypothetical protein